MIKNVENIVIDTNERILHTQFVDNEVYFTTEEKKFIQSANEKYSGFKIPDAIMDFKIFPEVVFLRTIY